MIKVGLSLNLPDFVSLYRLLKSHPDVDVKWIYNYGRVMPLSEAFPCLVGEIDGKTAETPDFAAINLYIGPAEAALKEAMAANANLKFISVSDHNHTALAVECPVEIGLSEYNRKALVRGARVAYIPNVFTILGALALMPLARNLLLGDSVGGSVLMASGEPAGPGGGYYRNWFTEELTERVLRPLQMSFNGNFRILPFNVGGTVSMATFVVDSRMNEGDLQQIYSKFYDDHRHVVLLQPGAQVRADMVEGSHKAVLSLRVADGSLMISVAFDSRFRTGHGNIVHLMNLLFGLDERTNLR